jgi:hypothetical protein
MSHSAPPDLEALAAVYRRERDRWRASPRAAEVRARLEHAARAAALAAEALGNLLPADLAAAGMEHEAASAEHERCRELAARLGAAAAELVTRGAARGGARPVRALYEPPPRFAALLRLRNAMPGASRRELLDAAALMFALAGDDDPSRGLAELARRLPRQNQDENAPVVPYPQVAA